MWERAQRILKAYRKGAVFGDAAYWQQVYGSHRRARFKLKCWSLVTGADTTLPANFNLGSRCALTIAQAVCKVRQC